MDKGDKVLFTDISGQTVRAIINGINDGRNWANIRITALKSPKWAYGTTFTTSVDQLIPRVR